MRRSLLVVLVLVTALLARAAPPNVKAAIARGRQLVKKADYAGAVRAFQEAVTAAPEDATALSELGLAAFKANDLKLAEQASRKSVTLATSPPLRAASLYNLGRVQEARGEKVAAIDSYRRSLEDRPNKIVRERLLGLDPKAAAANDPVAPQPLLGPFATLADFCKTTEQRGECTARSDPDSTSHSTFACDEKPVGRPLTPTAPYRAAFAFVTTCVESGTDNTFTTMNLAVDTGGKLWVVPALEESLDTMRQTEVAELDGLEVKDVVPGGAPELLVRTESNFDYRGMNGSISKRLRVVGLGASKKPSATGAILVEMSVDESDEDGNEIGHSGGELAVTFLPDGQLEITGPLHKVGKGLSRETLAALLGKHPLLFP
jgi:tetratricopeptide (TPR) repeat protein